MIIYLYGILNFKIQDYLILLIFYIFIQNNHLIDSKELHGCLHTHICNSTEVKVDEHIILQGGADVRRGTLQGIQRSRLNINLRAAADKVRRVCLSLSLLNHVGGQHFENPSQEFVRLLLSLI